MKKLWKNYSLSITLAALFLGSWAAQWVFQWQEFVQTSLEHSQEPQMTEYIPEFLSRTFENWQSEFLQLLTFVTLTTYFIHKGSHESKDTDEKMRGSLNRIEKLLKAKSKSKR